jgi:hypothetical protein
MNFEDELDRGTKSHIRDLLAICKDKSQQDLLQKIIDNKKPDESKEKIFALIELYNNKPVPKVQDLIIDKIGVFFINEVEFLIQEFTFELEHNVQEVDIHEFFQKPSLIRRIDVNQSKVIWKKLCDLDSHYEKSVDLVYHLFDEIMLSGSKEQQKSVKRTYKYFKNVFLEEIEFLVEEFPLNFE